VISAVDTDEVASNFNNVTKPATPLDLLKAVYRNPNQPIQRRIQAAIACLPFEHPRLSINANVAGLGDRIDNELLERLERKP